jgi:hypothetical protein
MISWTVARHRSHRTTAERVLPSVRSVVVITAKFRILPEYADDWFELGEMQVG